MHTGKCCVLLLTLLTAGCDGRSQAVESPRGARRPGQQTPIGATESRARRPASVALTVIGASAARSEDLSDFIVGRESQLRTCYDDHGLKVDSSMALDLGVRVRLADSGRVDSVVTVRRAWNGAPEAEAMVERCIHSRIRTWRLPSEAPESFTIWGEFTSQVDSLARR